MEEQIYPETPTLLVNETSKVHLKIAARWAKFLSIVGFIGCGIMILVSFFIGTIFSSINSMKSLAAAGNDMPVSSVSGPTFSYLMTGFYLIFAILYFFPTLYLYRFATQLKLAIQHENQDYLDGSFQNISKMFRFIGICTVIMLLLYGVIIICTVGLALFIAR